ncbi:hypothetical protein AB0B94_30715 [Micromonospora sp. NPDC048986]|uniref:hypothetical protein n=1 Tax=Micromonospora sp. NPDC048986 TaxID=3155644 RepID=UPI0033DA1B7E
MALPFARKQVIRFGDTWNQTFRELFKVGRDPQFLAGLDVAFDSSDRFFDKVNARIGPTSKSLSRMFIGSAPFVDQFGDSLLSYLDDFNTWIDQAAANGDLERFFADAASQADALLDIGKEIFVLVGRIGGMQQGSTLFRDMADALERFNDSASTTRDVAGIIETGNAAIRGAVDVLTVLGATLRDTLADPGTRDAVELFFNVLTAGAEVVQDVAGAFTALPDGLQSVLLAGAALALLWGKLNTVGGKLATVTDRATGALDRMGPAGERAGRGLSRTVDYAGKAATALIGLQVAGVVLDQFDDSAVKVDALNRSLRELALSGEVGGELTRQFGTDLERLNEAAAGASDGWFPKLGRAIEGIIPPVKSLNELMTGGSFTGSADRFRALDAELLSVAESTKNLDGVSRAYNEILLKSGLNVASLNKLLPATAQWMKDAQAEAHGLTREQNLLNGSMEQAIEVTGGYAQAWRALHGVQLTADEQMLATQEAIDAVAESFRENGREIEGNSAAALENRIAVGRAAEAAAEAASKKYEETRSVKDANAVYDGYITQLRKTLSQSGLTKAQVDRLVGAYAEMPKDVTTKVTANTTQALSAIQQLNQRKIPNKTFYINGVYRELRISGQNSAGGVANRWGGVYEHAQTGLVNLREAGVYSPAAVARYAFAEPATGGEAFIPRFGDRERSVGIGRQAMEWYGYDVQPKGALQAVWKAAMQMARPAPASPDSPVYTPAHFAQAVRAAVSGLTVTLDGRTVGHITGREADVFYRT